MSEPAHQLSPTAERKRLRILDAAASCFARLGYAKTTVAEIAREAGVSTGLLYVHFEGKESLLEAVLASTLEDWNVETWERVSAVEGGAPEKLAMMHRASIEFAQRHPLLQRILEFDALLIQSLLEKPARRAAEIWTETIRKLIQEGVDAGELRGDLPVEHLVEVLKLVHLGFVDRLFDPDWIHINDPELIDAGMALFLEGATPRAHVRGSTT